MRLFDSHAHTSDLSYCCAPGITPATYADYLAVHPELAGIAITNHGFAIYSFTREEAFDAAYMRDPKLFHIMREFGNQRLEKHLQQVESMRERGLCTGLEVELLPDGKLTFDPIFRSRLDVLIGSIHFLPEAESVGQHPVSILNHWWAHIDALLQTGIDILGHPFRWLHRTMGLPITDDLLGHVVEKARLANVAIELNAHMIVPSDMEMLKRCVKAGVPISLGSDSHALDEVGCLEYQCNLIRASGIPFEKIPFWLPKRLR